MKVHVVMTGGPEEAWVEGVYLNREAAETRARRIHLRRLCEARMRHNGEIDVYDYGIWTHVKDWDVADADAPAARSEG